jgi:hypothetical protein
MQSINSGKARRMGRNDACRCGSEKKYKHCHLPADEITYRKEILIGGALISPFVLMSIYLFISRMADLNRNFDYLALAMCLASGLPFIFKITKPIIARLTVIVFYLGIGWFLLSFYGLFFVCNLFHDCL